MKRAAGLALSFLLPLLVGGALLAVLISGGNAYAEDWLRAASFTVFPAAPANAIAAWIVALRPGASRPGGQTGLFVRALLTFLLALPLAWVFSTIAVLMTGDIDFAASASLAAVVVIFAAIMGVLPMTLLQWLAYHFTLDRRTA